MGRIKKVAGPKHEATLSPALAEFVTKASTLPLAKLPSHLQTFPLRWPFPRGDLYHWIPLLDDFDMILEHFVQTYKLSKGPQTHAFRRELLLKGITRDDLSQRGSTEEELSREDFGKEGDRELIESILTFSRILLENCGNRSLYNSSERLGDLLNTTSLSLLVKTLRLSSRLAMRYYASRMRGTTSSTTLNTALLATHYNLNINHVQRIADRFLTASRSPPSITSAATPATTPTVPRSKDKLAEDQKEVLDGTRGSDLLGIAGVKNGKSTAISADEASQTFKQWRTSIYFTYYPAPQASGEVDSKNDPTNEMGANDASPATPTPSRRTSAPTRPSRLSNSDDSPYTQSNLNTPKAKQDATSTNAMSSITITKLELESMSTEALMSSQPSDIPKEARYELFNLIRLSKALMGNVATRRLMLEIRLLAITNLAYIYPESLFVSKVLQADSDEPRRLQLVYQLAALIHSKPTSKGDELPNSLRTVAIGTLEALSKHKHRAGDVCSSLGINVSHGILFYILRNTVTELAKEDDGNGTLEADEWNEALCSLLDALPSTAPRSSESLVGAGLLDLLIEMLNLRTEKAERIHWRVLTFLNNIIHVVRDAFQAFANAKGLDAISDLISWEVRTSLEKVRNGQGLSKDFKTPVMDYQMPYFQQQTLRWLFKFVNHLMQHGNANTDRLLRNLIDSPPLLSGLRQVLENAPIFGSNIWSGAVNILSSFIHNEPTSYAVIAEAGLSQAFLDAISPNSAPNTEESKAPDYTYTTTIERTESIDAVVVTTYTGTDKSTTEYGLSRPSDYRLARGILPATDAIVTIPQAFGAICLNESGLEIFLKSNALDTFFEVFESPEHVKSMSMEMDLAKIVGNAFDELVRHHPKLRGAVLHAIVMMLARVLHRCRTMKQPSGAELKLESKINGGFAHGSSSEGQTEDGDTQMKDVSDTNSAELHASDSPSMVDFVSNATKFLSGVCENTALCASLISIGVVDFVLDLATIPSLPYDFNPEPLEIPRLLHMLSEHKPHLVLPTLITRAQEAVDALEPFMSYKGKASFFKSFVENSAKDREVGESDTVLTEAEGTEILQSLVRANTFVEIFLDVYSHPMYTTRPNHTLFSLFNLTDRYVTLVKDLGRLHRSCIWQEVLLQKMLTPALMNATRIKSYGMGSEEADRVFGYIRPDQDRAAPSTPYAPTAEGENVVSGHLTEAPAAALDSITTFSTPQPTTTEGPSSNILAPTTDSAKHGQSADIKDNVQLQNIRQIRFLLSQIPPCIVPFWQGLGRSLVSKRRNEAYSRQNAYMVAEALAGAIIESLRYELPANAENSADRDAYWIVALTSLDQLMIEPHQERPASQCLSLLLLEFKRQGGLEIVNKILTTFFDEVETIRAKSKNEQVARLHPHGGMKTVLHFYAQIINSKYIVDSAQSQGLMSVNSSEHPKKGDYNYFSSHQFLVELRLGILPVIQQLWGSTTVDDTDSSILKSLIDIVRMMLEADNEDGAFRRSDNVKRQAKMPLKPYSISTEKLGQLAEKGFDRELAKESLYRCQNSRETPEEYCEQYRRHSTMPRLPIPSYEIVEERGSSSGESSRRDTLPPISTLLNLIGPDLLVPPQDDNSLQAADQRRLVLQRLSDATGVIGTQATERQRILLQHLSTATSPSPGAGSSSESEDSRIQGMLMSIDNVLNDAEPTARNSDTVDDTRTATPTPSKLFDTVPVATIDDLDEARTILRENFIERVLDMLSTDDTITFELSDLVLTAAQKANDSLAMRRDISSTLIQSLISLQGDDFRPMGRQIASYANLLAIIIQDKEFYEAALDELKGNISALLGFVKVFELNSEPSSPWVGQVLIIIEKLLAEDVQPQQIKWTPPTGDEDTAEDMVVEIEEIVPMDEKMQLFRALVDILPRIGKDESLAISIVRVLAILTRSRAIAELLSDKKNLTRLFLMVKQLSGFASERFQSSFMITLRHIIEDDETLRQIMRTEIVNSFNQRPARQSDTTSYVRNMSNLIIRSPEIFLEVTKEKLKLVSFNPSQRPQVLMRKSDDPSSLVVSGNDSSRLDESMAQLEAASDLPAIRASVADTVQQTTEIGESADSSNPKGKALEIKPPVVENPDGVIHYLLSQLLSYKDVEDKEQDLLLKPVASASTAAPSMADGTSLFNPSALTSNSSQPHNTSAQETDTKVESKADQHPIHTYRVFLLQCLRELLFSYNRTKIEFINFSRKADPKAMTPSKPSSGVLKYLLNGLIPLTTLERAETPAAKKKASISNWAMSVVVALCVQTSEKSDLRSIQRQDSVEPDLLFVRKFVLEHALRSFKEAQMSIESLEVRYATLMSHADLFGRLLTAYVLPVATSTSQNTPDNRQSAIVKEIAKVMFEKSFIGALTSAIAETDLNYPNSRRAIKYMLRPIRLLTQSAIVLSENSELSSPAGTADDDEISTASSVSDMDDDREETPDLFRHSTLGMLEPGREEDSSSESSGEDDEDMYDDGYDDGIDYDEEIDRDGDEVISDEDEDIDDMGPIEGLPGDAGMDVEVVIDDDEDEGSEDESDVSDDDMDHEINEEDLVEIIDEINGDGEGGSMEDGDENEWEDEEDDEHGAGDEDHDDDDSDGTDPVYAHDHIIREDAASLVRELQAERGDGLNGFGLEDFLAAGMDMDAAAHEEDDEDEDDEDDDEDVEDEEDEYQRGYAEGLDMEAAPWGWDGEDDPATIARAGHHRPRANYWEMDPPHFIATGGLSSHLPTAYRSHRVASTPRGADDGTNPLLRRGGQGDSSRSSGGTGSWRPNNPGFGASLSDWVRMLHPAGGMVGMGGVSFINSIANSLNALGNMQLPGAGGPGQPQFSLQIGRQILPLTADFQAMFGGRRHLSSVLNTGREPAPHATTFAVIPTRVRWEEEARLLYGAGYIEKTHRIVNTILKMLVPLALQEEKERKRKEAEAEEIAKKQREEQEAKEKTEAEAKAAAEAQKKAEEEAKEQLRLAEQAAEDGPVDPSIRPIDDAEEADKTADSQGDAMEGVESTEPNTTATTQPSDAPEVEATPAAPTQRVRATFRGREVDITDLGIDLEYLNALPEELREEVLVGRLAEQRSQAATTGAEPTNLNPEFLDALPPDIRDELLQQEAQDRRRREREEARRQVAAANGGNTRVVAEDMDPASFLASLDPLLRNTVLADADENTLNQLPDSIRAEAQALVGGRVLNPWAERREMHAARDRIAVQLAGGKKPIRRQIVQMLDKPGVATILRLLFVPQQGNARDHLNSILHSVCANRQNRAEVVNILLSILQEGSVDGNAIERSFVQLSLRANHSELAKAKQSGPMKTPQTLKRTNTGPIAPPPPPSSEMTPLMVIQQCLSALVNLADANPHIHSFFLSEHETTSTLKIKSGKKGKGKEPKESRFPLNALLSLLDRAMIMDSTACMDQLSALLQIVTHPLTMLQRKDKSKPSEQGDGESSTAPATVSAATGEASSTNYATMAEAADVTAAQLPATEGAPTTAESAADQKDARKTNQEPARKQKNLSPPYVPEYNLRLVINILAARECSAKTFRDTLSTINNLSALPNAKETFGSELVRQAQALGTTISKDLDELISQIQSATSSTDVQGMALLKFSPSSSDQAKLLRVMTALDYLFDTKRIKRGTDGEVSDPLPNDILSALYENSTFGPLWSKLSECLTLLHEKENMISVATMLLPLVEALMVVCKNTTLRDTTQIRNGKDFAISSPPPDSSMENLFFRFTEDHRKVLNDLVRHNPRLMSGTFSLLVKNPKVLEFDNKRNYFTRRLHARTESRQPQPALQLSIRRDNVFLDSFKSLYFKSPEEMKFGKLNIRFHGEEGVDAGGVTREWFQLMSKRMFDANYALFLPVASDSTTFHPNKLSGVNHEHLMFFKFVGRVIGKALYEGRALDCHFSRAVYKRILGKTVSIKDMESLDLDYYKSLVWMLENDISEVITETFSVETDNFGVVEIVDLIENGRNIPVTEENKQEYVQLVIEHRLTGSVKEQLTEFLKGFHDIIPADLISIFNEQELELLISGLPDIDVDDWKNNTEYHNYSASAPQIQWFWRAVRSFDKEERAKLLQFVTGTSKVPLNGFKELEGMNGPSRFNIHRDYGAKDRLPSSHTCFNQLDLPEYESYEALRQQLYTAITAGSQYFGFA